MAHLLLQNVTHDTERKGKTDENRWRKATDLKPNGHDSRAAENYAMIFE